MNHLALADVSHNRLVNLVLATLVGATLFALLEKLSAQPQTRVEEGMTVAELAQDDPELAAEIAAWDAVSDEDFARFEEELSHGAW